MRRIVGNGGYETVSRDTRGILTSGMVVLLGGLAMLGMGLWERDETLIWAGVLFITNSLWVVGVSLVI